MDIYEIRLPYLYHDFHNNLIISAYYIRGSEIVGHTIGKMKAPFRAQGLYVIELFLERYRLEVFRAVEVGLGGGDRRPTQVMGGGKIVPAFV